MTSLHDLIFEKDDSKSKSQTGTATVPHLGAEVPSYVAMAEQRRTQDAAPMTTPSNRYYATLAAKTSPTLMATLQKIYTLAKPLEPIITDRSLRMRAAVAQAGVDITAVSSEFQRLSEILHQESVNFHQELENKKALVATKQQDAAKLEQQLQSLRAEIDDAQTKSAHAEDEFTAAYNQRDSELKQLAQESSTWR